jgi:hypothetical protein
MTVPYTAGFFPAANDKVRLIAECYTECLFTSDAAEAHQ